MNARLRMAPLIGCVLTTACYSPDSAPQDVEPVAEVAQPAAKGPPGVVWKDATGRAVGRAFVEGSELRHIDASGHVWNVDRRSGMISPTEWVDVLYYASNDCSGEPFASDLTLPRYIMGFPDQQLNQVSYWVLPDAAAIATHTICSHKYWYGCFSVPCEDVSLVPVHELSGLAPPDLQLAAPLHPEMP